MSAWFDRRSSNGFVLFCVAVGSAIASAGLAPAVRAEEGALSGSPFPLRVSENRRYLVDRTDRPFLVVGDTAWSLVADLNETDAKIYLDDRQRKGFNSIIVNLIENKFSTDPPRNRAGKEPFLESGDFSRPNPEYFDDARRVVDWANERGIAVWLCPAYLGWGGGDQGFFREIERGGVDKLKAYGEYVGKRFADAPNVVWMIGGDYAVPQEHSWTITELAKSIRAGGAKQLMTVHGGQQFAVEVVGEQEWIDLDVVYSYDDEIFRFYREAYDREPTRPFVLIESTYENEHDSKPPQIRRQAYWAMTCGACGQFFGNNPLWHFDGPGLFDAPRGWRKELDGVGSRDMARLRSAFVDRPWHRLVPDFGGSLVKSGVGEGVATAGVAATPEGDLAIVYLPALRAERRDLTIDMSRFAGPVTATWIRPDGGRSIQAATRPVENQGEKEFRTPGDSRKAADWLLILETAK